MITEQDRLDFEAKHKAPENIEYDEEKNRYVIADAACYITQASEYRVLVDTCKIHNTLWQGYQSALEGRQGEAVCEIKARPGDFRFMYWLKPLSELPVGTLLFTSAQPAQPDDNELLKALEFCRNKMKSATRCHENAVQHLIEEGLDRAERVLALRKGA